MRDFKLEVRFPSHIFKLEPQIVETLVLKQKILSDPHLSLDCYANVNESGLRPVSVYLTMYKMYVLTVLSAKYNPKYRTTMKRDDIIYTTFKGVLVHTMVKRFNCVVIRCSTSKFVLYNHFKRVVD